MRNETRTRGENTKVLKKGQKRRRKRMRTRKGPKREKTTKSLAYIRKKEKESCEERKHRNLPFKQPHSRRHYQKFANRSHRLRESRKRNPQAEERRQNKNPLPKNHRRAGTAGSDMERQGAATPGVRLRRRTTCGSPDPYPKGITPRTCRNDRSGWKKLKLNGPTKTVE